MAKDSEAIGDDKEEARWEMKLLMMKKRMSINDRYVSQSSR